MIRFWRRVALLPEPTQHRSLRQRIVEWLLREHVTETRRLAHLDEVRSRAIVDQYDQIKSLKQQLEALRTIVADLGVQQKQGPLHARNFSQVRQFMGNQEDVA